MQGGDWRSAARWTIALAGLIIAIGVFVKTWMDRVDGGSGAETAALNSGLYLERLFILVAIATVMLAVYIGSRADE